MSRRQTADAASARLPASPQARLPAALRISTASSARKSKMLLRALLCAAPFYFASHAQKGSDEMIHAYKLNGFNIVVDAASGAVHSVDEVAYDLIGSFDEKIREGADPKALLGKNAERAEIASAAACRHGIS